MVSGTGRLADVIEEIFIALGRRAGQELLADIFLHGCGWKIPRAILSPAINVSLSAWVDR